MGNELVIHYPPGSTLYALLFDATGQIWNGSAFAAPSSAAWTDYDIAMSEVATATGIYRASMPAAAAGVYGWVVRKQAGGSPAVTDIAVGNGEIRWTGTAEETVPASANVTYLAGQSDPVDNLVLALGNSDGIAVHPQGVADALKLAPTAGDPATGSAYDSLSTLTGASSMLDEPLADHNIAGTAGAKLNDIVANNVTVVADPDPGALEFVVGVTFDHTLEDLVIPSTWTACYFTLKSDKNSQADSASLIQIKVSNPAGGGDGLLRLTGSAPASPITAADASLVVSQAAGTVRIIVSDDALALLTGGLSGLEYDLKVKQSGGSSTRIAIDEASIEWTPTRTV